MLAPIAFTFTFMGATALSLDVMHKIGTKKMSIIDSTGSGSSWEHHREKAYLMRCEMVVLEKIQLKVEECIRRMKIKHLHELNVKFTITEVEVLVRNFPCVNGYGHIALMEMYRHSILGLYQKQLE